MSAAVQKPLSGYSLLNVYMPYAELAHLPKSEKTERTGGVTFGWDWRLLDESVFEVLIDVEVNPSEARDERLAVHVVGRFRRIGSDPRLPLEQFVCIQAVAILLPYARQFLSNLSVNSLHGAFYLQPINVETLVKGFDPSLATGAKQLQERSSATSVERDATRKAVKSSPRPRGARKR